MSRLERDGLRCTVLLLPGSSHQSPMLPEEPSGAAYLCH